MVESDTPAVPTADPPDAGAGPAFARRYPHDAELRRLVDAFARGDYRAVREEAPQLAERTANEDVRRAALDLRQRIEPDRMQVQLLWLTFALLAFLTAWFYLHAH